MGLCSGPAAASDGVEAVSLQLSDYHQFQFAGYYAADLCGYYHDEQLAVDIREFTPGMLVEHELTENRATFITYNPLILEHWARGADLFLIAIIHQRNPHVLMVRSDSPYQNLRDLLTLPRERRVAPTPGMAVDLKIGLSQLGVDPDEFFPRRKEPADFARFIAGDLDVYPGTISNEPARFRKAGVDVRAITILPHSMVTPGDTLLCSGILRRSRPDMVERFRRASLRGWDYALSHPRELIEHILSHRVSTHQQQSRDQLEQEAAITAEFVDKDVVPIGEVNQGRLESLAALMREYGQPGRVPGELVYHPENSGSGWMLITAAMVVVGALILLLLGWMTRLQSRTITRNKTHYQNLLDSADGFVSFRARLIDPGALHFDLASRSLEGILGHPLSWYQESERRFIDQIRAEDRAALVSILAQVAADPATPIRLRLHLDHPTLPGGRILMLHAMGMNDDQGTSIDGVMIDYTHEAHAERERALLQEQLQNAQRNESLGLLASGVAHDFNNILSAIRGNAELLTEHVPESHRYRMNRLLQAVDRASGLVRQILAYSGRGRVESKPLDLGEELQQIEALILHALPRNVQSILTIEGDLPPVMFDPAQFQQVAVNLIVNAAESYNGLGGEVQVVLDRFCERIRLRVMDRGCGMDQATMARIFDPYFTTKDHGHGLGLAAVQGIIASVSGSITCESTVGAGTTFTILLTPCASATNRTIKSPPPDVTDGVQFALVTDDDELVREITVETLTGLGYTCLQAGGGQECLRILEQDRKRICLLVLDCRMPDMDGITVLKRLRDRGDRLPVVLISGMINVDSVSPLLRDRRTRFLAKPFSQNQLSATLDVLFGSQSNGGPQHDSQGTAIMVTDVIRQRNEENNRREAGTSQYRKKSRR